MAYIYQATLWCDDCGQAICQRLDEAGEGPEDKSDETSFDSDDYPKGPFSDDDDESDSPSHCDSGAECPNAVELDDGSKVGAIVSGLTEDGIAYVRGAKDSPCVREWREHYELEPFTVHLDNLEGRDGCVMATVSGPGALKWAKDDQTIAGERWESADGDDFAYAMPVDHPGLVADLEKEGYTLNLDNYTPPVADPEDS